MPFWAKQVIGAGSRTAGGRKNTFFFGHAARPLAKAAVLPDIGLGSKPVQMSNFQKPVILCRIILIPTAFLCNF